MPCAAASSICFHRGRRSRCASISSATTWSRCGSFDPLSQRSTEKLDLIRLRPVKEFRLDEQSIERFRTRYRERFGAGSADDPLYESVTSGRYYAGMEHWLPLFHDLIGHAVRLLAGRSSSAWTRRPMKRGMRGSNSSPICTMRGLPTRRSKSRAARPTGRCRRRCCISTRATGTRRWPSASVALLSPFSLPDGHQHVIAVAARKGTGFRRSPRPAQRKSL